MTNNSVEIELRGKVIAMSLRVEDAITRIIYNFFYPKFLDKETQKVYLEEFILKLTFSRKIDILKQIFKTERYKVKQNDYLLNKKTIGIGRSYKDYDDYVRKLFDLLAEIILERNIIAHGLDMTNGFLALNEAELILANKTKFYKFSPEFLTEYSDKTLKAFLMLTMVNVEK